MEMLMGSVVDSGDGGGLEYDEVRERLLVPWRWSSQASFVPCAWVWGLGFRTSIWLCS
jgi:hypothetical protein